jgi:hypothetical protein
VRVGARRLICAVVAVTAITGCGSTGGPTFDPTTSPPVTNAGESRASVIGHYDLWFDYGKGYTMAKVDLRPNGAGSIDVPGEYLKWGFQQRRVAFFVTRASTGGTATYHGVLTATGFNSRSHPGTVQSTAALIGRWYATRSG